MANCVIKLLLTLPFFPSPPRETARAEEGVRLLLLAVRAVMGKLFHQSFLPVMLTRRAETSRERGFMKLSNDKDVNYYDYPNCQSEVR